MENTWASLVLAAVAGAGAGVFYFGGLLFATRRMADVRRPGLFALASFVVRLVPTLAIFYVVMNGRPERIIACLVGFIAARSLFLFWQRPQPASPGQRT